MQDILAADLGGTSCRFGRFALKPQGPCKLASLWLATRDFSDFASLAARACRELDLEPVQAAAFVLAVAGPVQAGRYSAPPNIAFDIDLNSLAGGPNQLLINDFKAQAHGCRANLGQAAQSVLPGEFDPAKVQVVVGAGTGFGKAALAPLPNGGYIVLPSEGGHSSLSFVTPEEFDFFRFACSKLGESYIRGDSLLSGSGLSLLHLYLSGLELSPPEVLAAAGPESPTLAWFARFFGRAARNYVLDVLGLGGLFVSGGVAAKNPHILAHPEFAAEFRLSPTHGDLLAKVGVKLNLDEELGLYGAALLASELAAAKGN